MSHLQVIIFVMLQYLFLSVLSFHVQNVVKKFRNKMF